MQKYRLMTNFCEWSDDHLQVTLTVLRSRDTCVQCNARGQKMIDKDSTSDTQSEVQKVRSGAGPLVQLSLDSTQSVITLHARTPGQFNDPILNPIYVYDLSIYCWDLRPESNKARSLAHLKLKPISLLYSFFHFSQIGPLRSLNKKKEKRRTQPMLSWIISL
jgi:hypothetical protein